MTTEEDRYRRELPPQERVRQAIERGKRTGLALGAASVLRDFGARLTPVGREQQKRKTQRKSRRDTSRGDLGERNIQVQQPRPVESIIDPNTGGPAFERLGREIPVLEAVNPGNIPVAVGTFLARQAMRNPQVRGIMGRFLGRSISTPAALPGPVRVGGQIATVAGTGLAVDQGTNWLGPAVSTAGNIIGGMGLPDISVKLPNINLSNPFGGGNSDMMQFPGVGGMMPANGTIVKAWDTAPGPGITGGGAFPVFALLVDGRIAVFSLDGSIKTYRPKKHIVIPTNPRLSQIRKLDRTHKRVQKSLRKVVPASRRR